MNRRTALFWIASIPALALVAGSAAASATPAQPALSLKRVAVANAYFRCSTPECRSGRVARVYKGDTARSVAETVTESCGTCGAPLLTDWRGPGTHKFGIDWSALG